MKCPKCGEKTRIIDVANVPETSEKYRKRECESCNHIFYTIEFEVENNEEFRKIWRTHSRKYKNNYNCRVKKNDKISPCPNCGSSLVGVDILTDEESGLLYKIFTCADCGKEYEE